MKLLTFDPRKNKVVLCGQLIGTTLFRNVKPEHFLKVVQGYGIQEVAFQRVMAEGVKMIVLKETHTKQRWEADIETWRLKSRVADYGHGKQRFLSMKYQKTHLLKKEDPKVERARQLSIKNALK